MYIISIIIAFFNLVAQVDSTENLRCLDFLDSINCDYEHASQFKRTCLSRRYNLDVKKTVRYELVFYGGKEIIIQCCTENEFYPIRFKLIKSESGKVIYDNKYNDYLDNINILLDHTELLAVEISLEAKERKIKKAKDGKACIGLAVYTEDDLKQNN